MKSSLYKLIALMAMLIVTNVALAASIPWQSYSNAAFSKAKAQKKSVLVYVSSPGCSWCSRMNNDVLSDAAVAQLINRKFVPVMVDYNSSGALVRRFQVNGTPTFIILDSNQREVSRESGYQSRSDFQAYLQDN